MESDEITVPSRSRLMTKESNVGAVSLVTQEEADNRGQRLLELVGKPELLNVEQLNGFGKFLSNITRHFHLNLVNVQKPI